MRVVALRLPATVPKLVAVPPLRFSRNKTELTDLLFFGGASSISWRIGMVLERRPPREARCSGGSSLRSRVLVSAVLHERWRFFLDVSRRLWNLFVSALSIVETRRYSDFEGGEAGADSGG
ncbi:hypothetical protein F2Q69_00056986 [Brassica cretica]|uniref:Uncharacterized protein n=1 Tax=Brassica cretica TaxID=69181 RepID=A0A8S9N1S9_BRACR|nr:hypothetical protein F2Q69_00056986 [Brassica cretica]